MKEVIGYMGSCFHMKDIFKGELFVISRNWLVLGRLVSPAAEPSKCQSTKNTENKDMGLMINTV